MKLIQEPYQEQMTAHLLAREVAYLMVGMSLGKTSATLMAARDLICEYGGQKGILIVAPLNPMLLVWPAEQELWDQFSWLKMVSLRTKAGMSAWDDGRPYLYLINWDSLSWFADTVLSNISDRDDCPVSTVVYDEMSRAKSHSSKRVNDFRKYRFLFDRHYALSGTPSPNGYKDLFAQFRLLDGGVTLGTAFGKFQKRFFYQSDWMGYKFDLKDGAAEEIEGLVEPFTLVMKTEDYLDIPPTTIIDREVTLPPDARKFYNKYEKDLLAEFRGKEFDAANAAVLVNKLTQATSGAVYRIDENTLEREWEEIHTVKMDELVKIRKEHKGECLLVVSRFQHETERILSLFPRAVLFTGKPEERKELESRWNRREIKMMIASPESMAHGLNLQRGGRVVVWISPTHSREKYDQLNFRLARRGQTEETLVYRILAAGTSDAAVIAVLERKGNTQAGLFTALKNIKILARHGH